MSKAQRDNGLRVEREIVNACLSLGEAAAALVPVQVVPLLVATGGWAEKDR